MRNIDLNTASREEFMGIEGIGPTLADKIVQFRDERGGIDRVDDLQEISGMSNSVLDGLRAASGESSESDEVMEVDKDEESEEW